MKHMLLVYSCIVSTFLYGMDYRLHKNLYDHRQSIQKNPSHNKQDIDAVSSKGTTAQILTFLENRENTIQDIYLACINDDDTINYEFIIKSLNLCHIQHNDLIQFKSLVNKIARDSKDNIDNKITSFSQLKEKIENIKILTGFIIARAIEQQENSLLEDTDNNPSDRIKMLTEEKTILEVVKLIMKDNDLYLINNDNSNNNIESGSITEHMISIKEIESNIQDITQAIDILKTQLSISSSISNLSTCESTLLNNEAYKSKIAFDQAQNEAKVWNTKNTLIKYLYSTEGKEKNKKAQEAQEKLIENLKKTKQFYLNRAQERQRNGDHSEGQQDLEKAAAFSKELQKAQNNKSSINKGMLEKTAQLHQQVLKQQQHHTPADNNTTNASARGIFGWGTWFGL